MPHHSINNRVTTRSSARRQKPPKPKVSTNHVKFQSVLRIRPLLKKEKDDVVLLEPANNKHKDKVAVAVLHPIMSSLSSPQQHLQRASGNLSSPKFIQQGRQEEFHFDKIFHNSSTQDDVYYSMGLNMATHAMEPLTKKSCTTIQNHVALVMGVTHSGKTFSTFGNGDKLARPHRHDQDGLVPRIIESLFSQSQHFVSSKKSFAVRMMLVQVQEDTVHDSLYENSNTKETPPSTKKKSGVMQMVASFEGSCHNKNNTKQVEVEQDATTLEYVPDAIVKTCWSASEARQVLHQGLSRGLSTKFAGLSKGHARGHVLITLQPVLIRGSRRDSTAVDKCGGTITFLDMAQTSRAASSGGAVRDAIANNSCVSAVQHVLRTIKHNQQVLSGKVSSHVDCGDEDTFDGSELSNVSEPKVSKNTAATSVKSVPYRQSKVTMLLQPHFTNSGQWNLQRKKTTTYVTTIMTAYPGHREYAEKRSLLNDLELLLGSDIAKRMKHSVNTGLDTPKHVVESKTRTLDDDTSEETSSLEMSDDDDDDMVPQQRVARPVQAVVPSAPSYEQEEDDDDVMPEPLPPPYAPGSQASLLHAQTASAPPIDQVYDTDIGVLKVSTEMQSSPALPGPPSSQRRRHVVDLPGVTIPPRMSASPSLSGKHTPRHAPTPPSTRRTPNEDSISKSVPSSHYRSPPLVDATRNKPLVAMASISSQPNIQPPRFINKENSPSTTHVDSSPSRNWKDTSPMKSISRAVHSSKKHGRKAMETMDRIVDRTVTKRMSSEFEPEAEASTSALLHRVKVLEKQNAKLTEKNEALTEKCELLTTENEGLRRSVNSSKMQWRRDCWTEQDEEDWKRSLRIRREQQDLIKSPLREHLENVHESYESSNQWMRANKVPFSLQFPNHWQRATALDERDRAFQGEVTAPPSNSDIPGVSVNRPRSNQKRTQLSPFKKRLDAINSGNKRYKRGERTPQY